MQKIIPCPYCANMESVVSALEKENSEMAETIIRLTKDNMVLDADNQKARSELRILIEHVKDIDKYGSRSEYEQAEEVLK